MVVCSIVVCSNMSEEFLFLHSINQVTAQISKSVIEEFLCTSNIICNTFYKINIPESLWNLFK